MPTQHADAEPFERQRNPLASALGMTDKQQLCASAYHSQQQDN
jgi:hypothetical protein